MSRPIHPDIFLINPFNYGEDQASHTLFGINHFQPSFVLDDAGGHAHLPSKDRHPHYQLILLLTLPCTSVSMVLVTFSNPNSKKCTLL
mmetsp:Transcript_9586/g.14425  ORF Transcript_9586/g.14425 Transcript_9586/m.14425 type:complete len:88 (-) Transcript_9586:164-427(-)